MFNSNITDNDSSGDPGQCELIAGTQLTVADRVQLMGLNENKLNS